MKLVAIALLCMVALAHAETIDGYCVDIKEAPSGCTTPSSVCSFADVDISAAAATDAHDAMCPEDPDNSSGNGITLGDYCDITYSAFTECDSNDDCEFDVDEDEEVPVAIASLCYASCADCFPASACEAIQDADEPQVLMYDGGLSPYLVAPDGDSDCFDTVKDLYSALVGDHGSASTLVASSAIVSVACLLAVLL